VRVLPHRQRPVRLHPRKIQLRTATVRVVIGSVAHTSPSCVDRFSGKSGSWSSLFQRLDEIAFRLLSRHGMSKRYRGWRIRRCSGAPPGTGQWPAARACRCRVRRPASGEPAKPVAGIVQPAWLTIRQLGRRRRSAPAGAHLCRPARPSFAGYARTCAPVPRPSREPHPSGG
jgi:hypothetical protein